MRHFLRRAWIFLSLAVFFNASCAPPHSEAVQFAVGGTPHELEFWQEVARDFESRTGIAVEILRQPADTDQRRQGLLLALNARRSDPDLFLMDVAWVGQFAASGWLETLRFENPEVFFTPVLENVDYAGGRLIALPVYVDAGLLYYRKDLLREAGWDKVPSTWAGFLQAARTVQEVQRKKDPDFYGFVWQGAQYEGLVCNFLEFAVSHGGGIRLEDGRVRLNTAANRQALQLMHDLIHRQKISPLNTYTEMKEEQVRTYFEEGHALFERNWPYAWMLHQREGSAVKGKIAAAPLPHALGKPSAAILGGWHVGVSGYSDQKEKALNFAAYLVSGEVQKKMALRLGWNPSRRDLYTDTNLLEKMPQLKVLREVFQYAAARPNVPYYTQISESLQRYLNRVLAGELEVEEGLRRAEREIEGVLKRYAG